MANAAIRKANKSAVETYGGFGFGSRTQNESHPAKYYLIICSGNIAVYITSMPCFAFF